MSGAAGETAAAIYPFLLCSGTAIHVPRLEPSSVLSFDIYAVGENMWEARIALLPSYRFEAPRITTEIVCTQVEKNFGAKVLGITALNRRH